MRLMHMTSVSLSFLLIFSCAAPALASTITIPPAQAVVPSAYGDKQSTQYGAGTDASTANLSAPGSGETSGGGGSSLLSTGVSVAGLGLSGYSLFSSGGLFGGSSAVTTVVPQEAGSIGAGTEPAAGLGGQLLEGVALGETANAMCVYVIPNTTCPPGASLVRSACEEDGNQFKLPGSCFGEAPGFPAPIPGVCIAPHLCQAVSAPGIGGIGNALSTFGTIALGASLAFTAVSLLLNKNSGSAAGGGAAGNPRGFIGGSGTICTTLTPVNDPTLTAANPCTYYVPSSGGGSGTAGVAPSTSILNILNGTSPSPEDTATAPQSVQLTQPAVTSIDTAAREHIAADTPRATTGGIQIFATGVTIFALGGSNASTTADFYGAAITQGEAPQKTAARLCIVRPWSLQSLPDIASAFFDTLCRSNGFAAH